MVNNTKLVKWFVSQKWKETRRSSLWQKNILINILIGFFIILMFSYLLIIGIFIDEILDKTHPGQNPVSIFNGILLSYFGIELMMRFLLQSVPVMSIRPYLTLPIKKSGIINYLLGRSLLSFFNFLPLLVFIPFTLKTIWPIYSFPGALAWIIGVFCIMLINNFITVYYKKITADKPILMGLMTALILSVVGLNIFDKLPVSYYSNVIFTLFITDPVYLLIPLSVLMFVYYLNYSFLKKNTYTEELNYKKKKQYNTEADYAYLKKFGNTGAIVKMQLKMIFRNKRPKSLLILSAAFTLYGLLIYTNPVYKDSMYFYIFAGVMMTGLFMLSYGNMLFSWDSSYFDGLLTTHIAPYDLLRAKLFIMIPASIISFVITLPYAFFGWDILAINTAVLFYNIGLSSFSVIYFAMRNPKYINLGKGSAFNMEGANVGQYIAMIPAFIVPVIIYLPFAYFDMKYTGILFIAFLGIIGIAFAKAWMNMLVNRFYKRKYIIAGNFRQNY